MVLQNGVYYSALKKNDILKFADKWMELEKKKCGNLDPERQTWHALTHKCILGIKQRITRLQSTIPEKLGNKGDSKRDMHGEPQEE